MILRNYSSYFVGLYGMILRIYSSYFVVVFLITLNHDLANLILRVEYSFRNRLHVMFFFTNDTDVILISS